jgi:hypothetical protein
MTLLSVVIPVRNAARYAPSAVRSALRGGGVGTEVVVSDNHSVDGTFELLQETFGHEANVRLIRPAGPLSMTAHFNFALGHATGKFVSVIGADDGLMPYFAQAMRCLVRDNPQAQAFVGPRAFFFWPGVADEYGDRSILLHGRQGVRSIDPHRDYSKALQGRINYAETLQLYAGSVVARTLVEQIRAADPDGYFFRGSQPDMYSTFALLSARPITVRTNYPLHWTGSSPASNGYQHASRVPDAARKLDFWELSTESDEPARPEFDHGRDTPVSLLVLDSAVRARRTHPLKGRRELTRVELTKGLVGAYARARPQERTLVRESAERFDPPIRIGAMATRARFFEVFVNRARQVLQRKLSSVQGGFRVIQRLSDPSICSSICEADELVAKLEFNPC